MDWMTTADYCYVLGLGSNLGDRLATLRRALELFRATPEVEVLATSRVYETDPVGPPQPRYLNAALRVRTGWAPPALLEHGLRVESRLGRNREVGVRWGPRTLDVDILHWSGGSFRQRDLTIPHAELERRAFALAPLLDVAPELEEVYGERLAALGGPPPVFAPAISES